MASWDGKPAVTAATLADGDKFPLSDQSQAEGSKDATITVSELREAMGGTQQLSVSSTAHGFSVGDVLRHNGTAWVESTANTAANAVVAGMVVAVPDVDSFTIAATGFVSGLSGLTAGSVYYLQDAGGLGTSEGTVSVPVLLAYSTTTGVLLNSGQKGDAGEAGGTTVTINAQTGTSYTLVLTDAGKLVTLSNAGAIALTVPTNASVAYPVGTVIALAQLGAGVVTVAGDTGVTVSSLDSNLDLAGQYATASLTKTATNTWLLSGGLA